MGNKFYSMLCAISFVSVLLFTFVHAFKKMIGDKNIKEKQLIVKILTFINGRDLNQVTALPR